ncbi:uncharacterized protein LOC111642280 [Centruroides sculpturatus]|uniref:uncharacterized protein LOC111642280 n=1 Tax=Centruroides sculpturatus TaxID=218467 RepID=UPI000C6E13EF|nr:uncharacterized protein LOC111642280 [Centruroides sculpturatus]
MHHRKFIPKMSKKLKASSKKTDLLKVSEERQLLLKHVEKAEKACNNIRENFGQEFILKSGGTGESNKKVRIVERLGMLQEKGKGENTEKNEKCGCESLPNLIVATSDQSDVINVKNKTELEVGLTLSQSDSSVMLLYCAEELEKEMKGHRIKSRKIINKMKQLRLVRSSPNSVDLVKN